MRVSDDDLLLEFPASCSDAYKGGKVLAEFPDTMTVVLAVPQDFIEAYRRGRP